MVTFVDELRSEIYSEAHYYNSGMDSVVWSEGDSKFLSHLIIIPSEFFEKPHPIMSCEDFKHLGVLLDSHSVNGLPPIKPSCHLVGEV